MIYIYIYVVVSIVSHMFLPISNYCLVDQHFQREYSSFIRSMPQFTKRKKNLGASRGVMDHLVLLKSPLCGKNASWEGPLLPGAMEDQHGGFPTSSCPSTQTPGAPSFKQTKYVFPKR